MIIGSEICTHCPLLSFVVTEKSRNKMVVPEGAARLSINQTISINWVCYYYYYIFITFDTLQVKSLNMQACVCGVIDLEESLKLWF